MSFRRPVGARPVNPLNNYVVVGGRTRSVVRSGHRLPVQHYAAKSQEAKGYALLHNVVYPWIARLRRDDPSASDRYFDRLEADATAAGDSAFVAQLKQRRAAVANLAPRPERPWLSWKR